MKESKAMRGNGPLGEIAHLMVAPERGAVVVLSNNHRVHTQLPTHPVGLSRYDLLVGREQSNEVVMVH